MDGGGGGDEAFKGSAGVGGGRKEGAEGGEVRVQEDVGGGEKGKGGLQQVEVLSGEDALRVGANVHENESSRRHHGVRIPSNGTVRAPALRQRARAK